MKIALAQIQSIAGDISANIERHISAIRAAAKQGADLVIFPELSLTNYEPNLAGSLATDTKDARFTIFSGLADSLDISIVAGMPLRSEKGITISCLVFQPGIPVQRYDKQILHADELPFFISGSQQLILQIKEYKIALAICYESVQSSHAENALKQGADIYLATVSKPLRALRNAHTFYSMFAAAHQIPVLMVNGVGPADNFVAAGSSAYWNPDGILVSTLDSENESLLLADITLKKGAAFAVF